MTENKKTYRWIPWVFVAGMTLVICVNAGMVFTALDSFSGLETDGHYRKGLAYNENLAGAKAQAERGWRMTYAFDERGLAVEFADRNGNPLEGLEVQAELIRPTHQGHDVGAQLAHQGAGVYRGSLAPPLPGQWKLRVVASLDGAVHQESRKIVAP